MSERDDLMEHLTAMTSLAQQLRDLNEAISSQKFATVVLGSLPMSYDTFITSLNARKADDLDWQSIKGPLIEEFMKREKSDDRPHDANFLNNRNSRQRYNSNRPPPSNSNKQVNLNPNGPTCYRCGEYGHIQRNCDVIPRNTYMRENNFKPRNTGNQYGGKSYQPSNVNNHYQRNMHYNRPIGSYR